jgi:hypothetical protein
MFFYTCLYKFLEAHSTTIITNSRAFLMEFKVNEFPIILIFFKESFYIVVKMTFDAVNYWYC